VGRNLPDKEFRYLRTFLENVIAMDVVYALGPHLLRLRRLSLSMSESSDRVVVVRRHIGGLVDLAEFVLGLHRIILGICGCNENWNFIN
jgi:hypothetical protein